ncbi:hypothetical protein LL038_14690 [Clostridium estertheticum]|uniref:Uncharacterized protein n=2 Tax=Clostridium estertheticum TaxID=238834 RepID=A0AA47EHS0_9CLOT|nr:hypothetical protein [Clostridium estertheticum]MBU3156433.1 hypothetical protein [Clostridium estertheticum]WAG58893.1 hypothetical protein LL038_14690 [Clostridium estertheticum]
MINIQHNKIIFPKSQNIKEIEHRQLWMKLIDINKRYCIFDKNEEDIIFEENSNEENIYEMLDMKTRELKARGIWQMKRILLKN